MNKQSDKQSNKQSKYFKMGLKDSTLLFIT